MTENAKAFKVKANDFISFFDKNDIEHFDIVQTSSGHYHLLHNHRSVNCLVLEVDYAAKKVTVLLEGETFIVEIKDALDQMLENMGFGHIANKQITEIKAPMPGLVLEIAVAEGDAVKEGSKIMILEAMKMENSILIHVDAIIKKINVSKGQAVEKGQVLVELK